MFELKQLLVCAFMVLFAVFGALVEWMNASATRSYALLIVKLVTSVFIGLIFYNLYQDGILPNGISHVCSGIGGFMGIAVIEYIKQWLIKRFGLDGLAVEKTVDDFDTTVLREEVSRRSQNIKQEESNT